ncbi:hypothetical protein [Tenggerimyces flavus]|uniref:Neutral/alkaline non-lysosomal ceramidase N-terminal domain-containing protein n=1 Tax=Tenggerimyces flavus TaxID=1708749 RepID=A0ABV7YA90_9ACTN|nr:hypothetical protein [Tenggerimyces flavus]MBM7785695.1 hypothetical protein [Tenggerimyces flavus]
MHAFTVSSGSRRLVWLVLDVVAVNVDLVASITDAVVAAVPSTAAELVWVSATHTHSGPETRVGALGEETPAWLVSLLVPAAVLAVRRAVAEEASASLTWHRGRLDGVGAQRSGPAPRSWVPVDVLAVRGPAGLSGAVAVLPVHPTVLGADSCVVSADLAGAVRRSLGEQLGARTWVMVATGAAGDVSTRLHRRAQTPEELSWLGELAASQLVNLLATNGFEVAGALDGAVSPDLPMPARTDAPDTSTIEAHRARLVAARASGDPFAVREAETALQGAELGVGRRSPSPRLAVSVLRIGDFTLVGLGGEPYLDLADLLPPKSVLVGYTGGYLGYLPTRAAYATPTYEVNMTPVAPGGAELAIEAAERLR